MPAEQHTNVNANDAAASASKGVANTTTTSSIPAPPPSISGRDDGDDDVRGEVGGGDDVGGGGGGGDGVQGLTALVSLEDISAVVDAPPFAADARFSDTATSGAAAMKTNALSKNDDEAAAAEKGDANSQSLLQNQNATNNVVFSSEGGLPPGLDDLELTFPEDVDEENDGLDKIELEDTSVSAAASVPSTSTSTTVFRTITDGASSVLEGASLVLPHLGGAIDIIAVRQPDGSIKSSPFYVRFGKYQALLRRREKRVHIRVNDQPVPMTMHVGRNGEAYFMLDDDGNNVDDIAAAVAKKVAEAEAADDFEGDPSSETSEATGHVRRSRTAPADIAPTGGTSMPPHPRRQASYHHHHHHHRAHHNLDEDVFSPPSGYSSGDDPVPHATLATVAAVIQEAEAIKAAQDAEEDLAKPSTANLDEGLQPLEEDVNTTTAAVAQEEEAATRGEDDDDDQRHDESNNVVAVAAVAAAAATAAADDNDESHGSSPGNWPARGQHASDAAVLSPLDVVSHRFDPTDDDMLGDRLHVNNASADASSAPPTMGKDEGRAPAPAPVISTTAATTTAAAAPSRGGRAKDLVAVLRDMDLSLCAAYLPSTATMATSEAHAIFNQYRVSSSCLHRGSRDFIGHDALAESLVCRVYDESSRSFRFVLWRDAMPHVLDALAFGTPVIPSSLPFLAFTDNVLATSASEASLGGSSGGDGRVESTGSLSMLLSTAESDTENARNIESTRKAATLVSASTQTSDREDGESAAADADAAVTSKRTAPSKDDGGGSPRSSSWSFWPFSSTPRAVPAGDGAHKLPAGVTDPAADADVTGRSPPDDVKLSEAAAVASASSTAAAAAAARRARARAYHMRKTLQPPASELAQLGLVAGSNTIDFTFENSLLGRQTLRAYVYLLDWDVKIVVSDIDGTITKSDVLGHIMPMVGQDWSHAGVAKLFHAIVANGYQMMYLSARAISQAATTRDYLRTLSQDGVGMPSGPVIMSPDGMLPSLYREVVLRRPQEFKISCLSTIRALFPEERNPFYAGFGNRPTDEVSYEAVGVPRGKIFTINPRGEVTCLSSRSFVLSSPGSSLTEPNSGVGISGGGAGTAGDFDGGEVVGSPRSPPAVLPIGASSDGGVAASANSTGTPRRKILQAASAASAIPATVSAWSSLNRIHDMADQMFPSVRRALPAVRQRASSAAAAADEAMTPGDGRDLHFTLEEVPVDAETAVDVLEDEHEAYNDWNYWSRGPPVLVDDDELV